MSEQRSRQCWVDRDDVTRHDTTRRPVAELLRPNQPRRLLGSDSQARPRRDKQQQPACALPIRPRGCFFLCGGHGETARGTVPPAVYCELLQKSAGPRTLRCWYQLLWLHSFIYMYINTFIYIQHMHAYCTYIQSN